MHTIESLATELDVDTDDLLAIIDGDPTGTDYMVDDTHLTAEGVETLTDQINADRERERAEEVAAVLPARRLQWLNEEIGACRQVQSWAPGATRSGWVTELEAIIEAYETGTADQVVEAIKAAEAEAHRLATVVARCLLDVDSFRRSLTDETDDQDAITALDGADTVAELVEVARRYDIEIDDGTSGRRDGYVLNAVDAYAFSTSRSMVQDSTSGIEIDLLTGEARDW